MLFPSPLFGWGEGDLISHRWYMAVFRSIYARSQVYISHCLKVLTFIQNVLGELSLKSYFMSHLATQLGYSAGEFQALQLIVLTTFACWSTFWKSIFKQLGCRFDIMDSNFFLYFDICKHICLDASYHFWLYLYFLNILYVFNYSCTNIFQTRSLCIFYCTVIMLFK